jgi:hypothetical protein
MRELTKDPAFTSEACPSYTNFARFGGFNPPSASTYAFWRAFQYFWKAWA